MVWKFPEIPRPRSVVHLHYLEHFGASVYFCHNSANAIEDVYTVPQSTNYKYRRDTKFPETFGIPKK